MNPQSVKPVAFLALAVLLSAVWYSGKQSNNITDTDLVGRWVPAQDRNAAIIFRSDKTFKLDNLPAYIFEGDHNNVNKTVSRTGHWEMDIPPFPPSASASVTLYTQDRGSTLSRLYYLKADKNTPSALYFEIGDPDENKTYDLYRTKP